MTTHTLQAHARALALAHNVRLIETDVIRPDEAFATVHGKLVVCHPIIEDTTYAVVLHELGHLATPAGMSGAIVEMEREAWRWARAHAIDWTPAMEAVATWAEGTYAAGPLDALTPDPLATPVVPTTPIHWNDEPATPAAPVPSINWSDWE